jgi:hypothetical protein
VPKIVDGLAQNAANCIVGIVIAIRARKDDDAELHPGATPA